MRQLLLIPVLVLLLGASIGPARSDGEIVHYVDNLTNCTGLAPCTTTIMSAVDAAVPLDIIEVFPGVYHETVVLFKKDGVVLRGHGEGAMPTIVAPAGANAAVAIALSIGVQVLGFILEAPDATGIYGEGGGAQDAIIEGNLINARAGISFTRGSFRARNNSIFGGGVGGNGVGGCLVETNTVVGGIGFGEFNGGPVGNRVLNNVVIGGGINFNGRPATSNVAASNVVLDGDIRANGWSCTSNQIRGNVVRGGGVEVGFGALRNSIEGNFTSGSPYDGIQVDVTYLGGGGGNNSILSNTSVDNTGCDLNDISAPIWPVNLWVGNRYRTACGAAVPVAP